MKIILEKANRGIALQQAGAIPSDVVTFMLANYIKLNWRGVWSSESTYNYNDAVSYLGSSYVALRATTEQPSESAADWKLIAKKGEDGLDGRGIVSFDLFDVQEKTKIYRLLYTDATYQDISIIDGNDGVDGLTPYIGINGNWWIGDVDQNIKAEGVDGISPTIGMNGNWYLGTTDTGVKAQATSTYEIYIAGGGTLSEVDFNAAITNIPSHIDDTDIHVTTTDKSNWDAKADLDEVLKLNQTTPQTIQGLLQNQSTAALESAPLSDELLTSSNWTTTGWTGDFVAGFTHTTGNVTPLTNTLAAINATLYQITYTITNRTAGSISIVFGGVTVSSITATGAVGNKTVSTGALSIAPTSDFNGTLVISIKRITGTYAPTYQILDSTGISTIEIRGGLNTRNNLFIGKGSGRYITTGSGNTNSGFNGQYSLTTGSDNTNSGFNGQYSLTTGSNNANSGTRGQYSLTTGVNNTNSGTYGQYSLTTGNYNTNNGMRGQYSLATGNYNTTDGYQAARYITGGVTPLTVANNCTYIGANTKAKENNVTNETVIGYDATGNGSNTVTIGHTNVTDVYLRGKGHFTGSVQIGDDTAAASYENRGATRYRENAGGSFYEMVMKKQDGSYAWTTIVSYQ